MEKVENRTVNYSEFGLLGVKMDLFGIITHNRDERWLRNRWNVSDFKITESRRLNFGKKSLVYYDITNKITNVAINILISPTDLEDYLKMYDWGERQ
jgi:hypothetical protein